MTGIEVSWRGVAKSLCLSGAFLGSTFLSSADAAALEGYKTPPAPIPAMIDAPPTPLVTMSHDRRVIAILGRENLPPVAALAQPILRLAGWRVNPQTSGPAEIRMNWLNALSVEDVRTGRPRAVALPQAMRFSAVTWSPDDKKIAFIAEAPHGLELWTVDVAGGAARRVTGADVNGAFGLKYEWTPDSAGLVFLRRPGGAGPSPAPPDAPDGPTVQENLGRVAPARTYEDLLANAYDERLFEHYFTSTLTRVDVATGSTTALGASGLISAFELSPDGQYILTERVHRPFSHLVPSELFPTEIAVLDATGRTIRQLTDRPLADDLPIAFDAVPKGPRDASWRDDAPATLVFVEARDGGDPERKVDVHDEVLTLKAPFDGAPSSLATLKTRFSSIAWGRSNVAVVTSKWWRNRHETRTVVDPSGVAPARVLLERNYQDQLQDPGVALQTQGPYGRPVMAFTPDGAGLFVTAPGGSAAGEHPFLARMDLATGAETKLWQSKDPYYEEIEALLRPDGSSLLTRRESHTEAPNYFVRAVAGGTPRPLTDFKDPEPQFAGVTTELLAYKRADGVDLSGTLYLPPGYDKARDGPLPMLMWAYPTEFTDAKVAGQVVDRTKNRFTRPKGISELFVLTQGYAVFDGFSAPIIGEHGAEPNDTYIEQLVADAKAAVDAVVARGVADRARIAVGGHSYGAFMTANLLAHSDLFRAGIARSGAYNRSLTPFGFQAEQRTYWQATDTYTKMSPFTFARMIKAPILLIHGEADDNQGTFPIQSERFYAALKGAGATVRYVTLPFEPHGYRGRESTLDVQAETIDWLDRYVKPKAAGVAP